MPSYKPKQQLFQSKYINLGEKSSSNTRQQSIGEPVLLNPNSYENIEHILESLKANLKIGTDRQWSYVGCDGPPYCLASRLAEKDKSKYEWLTLVPGLGHLNMNQMKSLLKVTFI